MVRTRLESVRKLVGKEEDGEKKGEEEVISARKI